ncbi:dTDP-4-dehydrorhamnose 3,5-epimerase [Candidatus Peregrinibacteria bacterium]|jgi:dTDP-4-dehydrorhamnose 3,5-epimerase|nr:dTDP-4-dehydrorhamnose 3,5-epimerase [Candidatus Peregrinibacteria bacterium]
MKIEPTKFPDVYVLTPNVYGDSRGYFHEVYQKERFHAFGLTSEFVQDNLSKSAKRVLRGLHFQWNPHQGKLVRAVKGKIFDVVVDIKRGSPTFGQWTSVELSEENHKMFWIPPGYAHGFLTLSDEVILEYKCTGTWNGDSEASIRYDDPEIGIVWPLSDAIVSEKDLEGMSLREWAENENFGVFNDTLPPILKLES